MARRIIIDITDFYTNRSFTGIQRVVRSIGSRMLEDEQLPGAPTVVYFDYKQAVYRVLSKRQAASFFEDPKAFDEKPSKRLKLSGITKEDIYYDIDSAWNVAHKRPYLYSKLKEQGCRIITLCYDLAPVLNPESAHQATVRNFSLYLSAVYTYADLVMCISRNTEKDFLEFGRSIGVERDIPTVVTRLGSEVVRNLDATQESVRPAISSIAKSKYLLFVGTIEPRKGQSIAYRAYKELAESDPELKLVFVGKPGWNNDRLIEQIKADPLFDDRILWPENVSDAELDLLYQKAFINIYLSSYEGYGLPIAESLARGTITIGSKNSSMYEVGLDYADYVCSYSVSELKSIIYAYLNDKVLYRKKQNYIRQFYNPLTWAVAYQMISAILQNLDYQPPKNNSGELQFVFISNRINDIKRTIKNLDKTVAFVKDYIVVCPPGLIEAVEKIPTKATLVAVNEETLLGDDFEVFKKSDHVRKNWLLRTALLREKRVDEEFIMLDDDNQFLVDPGIEYYKHRGVYRGYYYHELTEWAYSISSYDMAQHYMREVLNTKGYEMLSYSSHMPQIINKKLFAKSLAEFKQSTHFGPVDEWSSYFNYMASNYPLAFRKQPYQVLNWPARPTDWQYAIMPNRYVHENYYEHLYDEEIFKGIKPTDKKRKLARKNAQLKPFKHMLGLQRATKELLTGRDMYHGMIKIRLSSELTLYVSNIPYVISSSVGATVRLFSTYKIIGSFSDQDEIYFHYNAPGYSLNRVRIRKRPQSGGRGYSEGLLALPINTPEAGRYTAFFSASCNGKMSQPSKTTRSIIITAESGQTLADSLLAQSRAV